MGQKTHPHGLRVGIHRKWNSTWFAQGTEYPQSMAQQRQIEDVLINIFQNYTYTKASETTRFFLVDVRLFKQGMRRLYLFILFYKFRSKRPRTSLKQTVSRRSIGRGTTPESKQLGVVSRKSWPISRQNTEGGGDTYTTETE